MNHIHALGSLVRDLLFEKSYSRRQFAAVSMVLIVVLATVLANMKRQDDAYIRQWKAEHSAVAR